MARTGEAEKSKNCGNCAYLCEVSGNFSYQCIYYYGLRCKRFADHDQAEKTVACDSWIPEKYRETMQKE